MPWLIIVVLGYLLGSIPTAYIAGRLLKGRDIRQMGDGNVGAANAFRQLGGKIGVGVFFVDTGKGALAILIAQAVGIPQLAILTTGVAAVIGHNWPAFLGFRGGKGFSTTLGVLAAVITQPMLILVGPALVAFFTKRSTGIAGGVMFVPLPLVCWWLRLPGVLVTYSIALPCLVGFSSFLKTRRAVSTSETKTA